MEITELASDHTTVLLYAENPPNPASDNQSSSSSATASNSQRKVVRESSGVLHEVFEHGGEIVYRKSTNDGASWQSSAQISSGFGDNGAPCITMAIPNLLVGFQNWSGTIHNVQYCRSTNGGSTWAPRSSLGSAGTVAAPGPMPSISLYGNGRSIAVYRTQSGLRYRTSTNSGANWASEASIPNTTANWNLPSSTIYAMPYGANKQANLVYATHLPGGSPQIQYNYFEFGPNTWGTAANLTGIIPARYTKHANPCIGHSASEPSSTKLHVVWDAEDSYYPGTQVIIHREGDFRSWPGSYSVLVYQSENKPSITGGLSDRAWMVYQSSSAGSVWKRYYDGTYWTGAFGTWVGPGFNPQISVGSTSAKYIYTQGSASPYQIVVGAEVLSKEGPPADYARALNVIDPESGAYVSLEIGKIELTMVGADPVVMQLKPPDDGSGPLDVESLEIAGESEGFVLPTRAQDISIHVSLDGSSASTLFGESGGTISLDLVDATTGQTVKRMWNTGASSIEDQNEAKQIVHVDAAEIPAMFKERTLKLRPAISGLFASDKRIFSIGHIYRCQAAEDGASKPSEQLSQKTPGARPTTFVLHDASPNPFNPSTRITYDLSEPSRVELKVFDMLGREVGTLSRGYLEAGIYTAQWDATGHASGVYLARLLAMDDLGNVKYNGVTKLLLAK
jgi:hypothetical protein